jgi:hypothetical protein
MDEVVNCQENTIRDLMVEINKLTKQNIKLQEHIKQVKIENNKLKDENDLHKEWTHIENGFY